MRKKSLFKLSVIVVYTALILSSCKKEDNNDDIIPDTGGFTCKIDGVTFTAVSLNNTLIGDATGKRLDIRGTDASGKQLIITVNDVNPIGTNFSHIGDTVFCDPFENTPNNIMTLGTLKFNDNSWVMTTTGDGKLTGYSILTSCDLSNKKASGIFKLRFIIDDTPANDTIHVTEGVYSNVKFN